VTQGLDPDKTQLNKTILEPAADVETHANTLQSAREGAGEGGEVNIGGEGREGREGQVVGAWRGRWLPLQSTPTRQQCRQLSSERTSIFFRLPASHTHGISSHGYIYLYMCICKYIDMCMYLCVYIHIHIYIYMSTHICAYTRLHMYT